MTKPTTRRRGAQRKLAECVFKKGFVTETVDPLIDEMWKASIPGRTPFGDLRNQWRRHHCRTLNPYGDSENCPYDEKDCARAFYAAVRDVVRANDRVGLTAPVGYFLRVAKSRAAIRADEAVGRRAARARMRTDVPITTNPDPASPATQPHPDAGAVGGAVGTSATAGHGRRDRVGGEADRLRPAGPAAGIDADHVPEGRPVPGRRNGPISVGDLFGRMALGPRERPTDDRPEGPGR